MNEVTTPAVIKLSALIHAAVLQTIVTTTGPIEAIGDEKQNGITRPVSGTKTGLVFDVADAVFAYRTSQNIVPAVPLVGEVKAAYKRVVDGKDTTCSQQFGVWLKYMGLEAEHAARKASEVSEDDKAKIEADAKKANERLAKTQAMIAKQQERANAAMKKMEALKAKIEASTAAIAAATATTETASAPEVNAQATESDASAAPVTDAPKGGKKAA